MRFSSYFGDLLLTSDVKYCLYICGRQLEVIDKGMSSKKEGSLQSLIHALNEHEYETVKIYLTAFSSRQESGTKTLALLDLYRSSKEALSDNDCSTQLYGIEKNNRFEKIKSRLKQKILDSLISDINLDRDNELETLDLVQIKLRKKLSSYYFLTSTKPKVNISILVLDEIISQAKKFELFAFLCETLMLKKLQLGLRLGESFFDKINSEIKFYSKLRDINSTALDLYYKVGFKQSFHSSVDRASYSEILINSIKELNQIQKEGTTTLSEYFRISIEIQSFLNEKNYNKVRDISLELFKIINHPAIYRRQRIANNYLQLCECEIYLGNYIKAKEYAEESKNNFRHQSVNYLVAIEMEFFATFYNGEYCKAESLSNSLQSAEVQTTGAFRNAKHRYFNANALFAQDKFHETLKALRENSTLSDDKTGWDIGLRTLIILSHIELEAFDQAENATEALRKSIERSSKERQNPVKERDKVIYQILRSLATNSYNFPETSQKEKVNLALLSSADEDYRWEKMSHELIQLNSWFDKKLQESIE